MRLLFAYVLLPLALSASALVSVPRARAQSDSVELDRYVAAPTSEDGFALSRPDDRGHLQFGARLDLDYALNPLVVEGTLGDPSSERQALVEHALTARLALHLGLFDRLVVFAGLPVALVQSGAAFDSAPAGDGAGLGDAFLGIRGRLYGESGDVFALAIQAAAILPTAAAANAAQRYTGEDGFVFQPALIAELRPIDALRLTANLGARLRGGGPARVVNLSVSHELTYGVGATFDAVEDLLAFYLEVYGAQTFENIGGQGARESGPFEGLLGARVRALPELTVGLAGGMGFTRGYGSPDFRAVLTAGWASREEEVVVGDTDGDGLTDDVDQCVDEPEDVDSHEDDDGCPDPDNDGDGILDAQDACPMEPETVNDHEDADGCPDGIPDTDGDGLPDDVDQCVDQPEDQDGFEDEDGCPDADNDGDGVMDEPDSCPDQAGPAENRGCPDTDRDSDTVVDRQDNCPDVAGSPENQGCPDEQRVRIESGRLEILERVFFRTDSDRLQRRSHALLTNVAQVLNNHPEIQRIIVEGHTDSRGDHDHNVDLSQRRAESVVRFLVEAGVDAGRLTARGYGPDRPRAENASTAREHAQNRRVEFNIPSNDGVQPADDAAGSDGADR